MINGTNANTFLNNWNNVAVDYSTGTSQDQQQLQDLQAALAYLSDPANQATEDSQNGAGYSQSMLQQLNSDITEQQNVLSYYGGNATPQDIGTLQTQVGNVGNLTSLQLPTQQQLAQMIAINASPGGGSQTLSATNIMPGSQLTISDYLNQVISAIQNTNSPMALQAANNAAGQSAQGFQQGATTGNIGEHINGSADPNATAAWLYNYISSAQQGYQQLTALQDTQQNEQNAILSGFTLPNANTQAQEGQLANYYGVDAQGNAIQGDNSGQVQIAQGQAGQSISQQAYQQRQQVNQQANNAGASSSGQRTQALGNITAKAAQNASGIYQQDATAAEQAINNYNNQLQSQNNDTQSEVNSVKGGNFANFENTATSGAINSTEQNQNATNQQDLTNNENAINTAKQNSSLWNNIGSSIGQGVGQLAGVAVSKI